VCIYIISHSCIAARAGDTTKNYKDHTAAAAAEPNIAGIINIQYYYYYYYDIRHDEIVYSALRVVLYFSIYYIISYTASVSDAVNPCPGGVRALDPATSPVRVRARSASCIIIIIRVYDYNII